MPCFGHTQLTTSTSVTTKCCPHAVRCPGSESTYAAQSVTWSRSLEGKCTEIGGGRSRILDGYPVEAAGSVTV
jgi:hypothetical protein